MYEYRKSDDVEALMEIASFSFAVKKSKHEFLRKYISTAMANGVEMYGVYDSNKLVEAHLLYPFQMRFRNSMVSMGGIGMVCSRPDYRGKGTIRFMLEKSIRTMRDKEVLVSALQPFDVSFYRKYGWELFY